MWETQVQSLGKEDPLEKGMLPTPVFLPGELLWTEMPGRLQSMESQSLTCLSVYALHKTQPSTEI